MSRLSKKHFKVLAENLYYIKDGCVGSDVEDDTFDDAVSNIADLCEELNENFNQDSFFEAIYQGKGL